MLLLGDLHDLHGSGKALLVQHTLAHGVTLCGEESIGHGTTNDEGINFLEQAVHKIDLVRDLGTTDDGDEGMSWGRQESSQSSDLTLNELACGVRQEFWHAHE